MLLISRPRKVIELEHRGVTWPFYLVSRCGRLGRQWILSARVIQAFWWAKTQLRHDLLVSTLRRALERAKRMRPPRFVLGQGNALIECFGLDCGSHVQQTAAALLIQKQARIRIARRRSGIGIKLVSQDGNEVFFRVKMHTSLGVVMAAYANRMGMNLRSLRFLFDGERIRDDHTPNQLDMYEGDCIDVMVEQIGD